MKNEGRLCGICEINGCLIEALVSKEVTPRNTAGISHRILCSKRIYFTRVVEFARTK